MDVFGIQSVPFMARKNYAIEIRHLCLWGIFAGMFEGSVSSIVVAKTFDAGPWLITIVMATPMFSNIMGLAWGTLATGRRKLPLFMMCSAGCAAAIGSVALAPAPPLGGWIFAGQILLARVMLSGCMTLRASLWKHNYPAVQRGRIAARLQTVRFSIAIATVTCVSLLFDLDPTVYVYVYPIAALVGAAAVLLIGRLHVRGERAELQAIAEQTEARRTLSPFSPFALLREMRDVLRGDPAFARYCTAMMFIGCANMMVMPIMTIIVTKQLCLSYYHSCNLMEVLPRVLMMGSLMPWASFFDRVGVVRFRVINACVWASAAITGGIGAWIISRWGIDDVASFAAAVAFIALSRTSEGLGKGGGAIAWNLGHLHFAQSAKAEMYMGTHVFLTGLRGMAAPFLGTFLYIRFGPIAFVVAFLLSMVGLMVFMSLARSERAHKAEAGLRASETDRS